VPAGFPDPGVEPEVADQLVRAAEPGDVADRGHDRQGDDRVESGDAHQAMHVVSPEGDAGEVGVDA